MFIGTTQWSMEMPNNVKFVDIDALAETIVLAWLARKVRLADMTFRLWFAGMRYIEHQDNIRQIILDYQDINKTQLSANVVFKIGSYYRNMSGYYEMINKSL
jgi:hypothetical protein